MNQRKIKAIIMFSALLFLSAIVILGILLAPEASKADFIRKNLPPSVKNLFGTDWLGRDMLTRTLTGLSFSIRLGLLTATLSALIALLLGTLSAVLGSYVDTVICWFLDLMMGIPHILLLILISFACGKGFQGVVISIIFTHWMSLTRLIRGEAMQLMQSGYIRVAKKLGVSTPRIIFRHLLPQIIPQFATGLILLFPHAILHEASITFLGFGLSPEQPAIGMILSESMRYLITGQWWLGFFPGLLLVLVVLAFDRIGNIAGAMLHASSVHE